jgi:hypothetical protein
MPCWKSLSQAWLKIAPLSNLHIADMKSLIKSLKFYSIHWCTRLQLLVFIFNCSQNEGCHSPSSFYNIASTWRMAEPIWTSFQIICRGYVATIDNIWPFSIQYLIVQSKKNSFHCKLKLFWPVLNHSEARTNLMRKISFQYSNFFPNC